METKHDFDSVKANTQTKHLDGETAKMNTQLVPMQFVAGGGSIWLNCGRVDIWELLVRALLSFSIALVGAELVYSLYMHLTKQHIIQSCSDIRNTECFLFDNFAEGHLLDFRLALGLWAACGGFAFGFLACMCLQVASEVDKECLEQTQDAEDDEDGETLKGSCCPKCCTRLGMYVKAFLYQLFMFFLVFIIWPAKYMATAICAMCRQSDQQPNDEDDGHYYDLAEFNEPLSAQSSNAAI